VTTTTETPALAASRASWDRVGAHDRDGWLALMADDVHVEDPIGPAITNPDGAGVRGRAALGAFWDTVIEPNRLTVTCEETFPSSSPAEVAHVLVLRTELAGGGTSTVRGVFTYRVDEAGLIAHLRGYWTIDAMRFDAGPA
jgi:steroid delta-isomerase